MISITYPGGERKLSKEELILLQEACFKFSKDLCDAIYQLRVYYPSAGAKESIDKMKQDVDQIQKLRVLFEDLMGDL